ncbi:MAG: ABC transporter ATP-binding protein/permease [Acholeplasmatales bacterium]|jgi:ATP-binding cassette subfamily B protein|nr:ABC transporter ATP-binding protein/permease [Acholeplasmatales bacterium]
MKDFVENTRLKSDTEIIKRLLLFAKKYLKQFIIVLLLMFGSIALQVSPPIITGIIIDRIFSPEYSDHDKIMLVIFISSIYIFVIFIIVFLLYFQNIILQKTGQAIVTDLRKQVYDHIVGLSIGQINSLPIGKLVTRVVNDTNSLSEMFTNTIVNLLQSILYMIGVYVILFIYSWKLTLILTALLPIIVLSVVLFRKYSRYANRQIKNNASEINAFLSENMSGMKIIQIFNQEEKKKKEFEDKSLKLTKSYVREIIVFAIFRPFIYFMYIITLFLVLYYGIKEVNSAPTLFTYGMLYTVTNFIQTFFDPVQNIAEQFNVLQDSLSSAEKIFDVLDTKNEIVDKENAIELVNFTGHIEFINVSFSYVKSVQVLKNISFEINPGDTIALVGATGSGKTTILGLLARNYDVDEGNILLDGIDIRDYTISSIRRNIGQMLQDVFLFNDTISKNLTLDNDSITPEEYKKAAEYVNADKVINKLNLKYDHMVLERGNNFSSGEKQLISFARTLAYKPRLLILDEATSNIDSETEVLIQESLSKMMSLSTMIIVAHRLSTIQHATKIIVMQKGEIKESGNHQELLSLGGIYHSLYELQYKDEIE